MQVDPKQRYLMITEAAYFLAERRNFAPGHEQVDWLAAEQQVDEMLKALAHPLAIAELGLSGKQLKSARKTAPTKAKAQPEAPAKRSRKSTKAPNAAPSQEESKPARNTRQKNAESLSSPKGDGRRRTKTASL